MGIILLTLTSISISKNVKQCFDSAYDPFQSQAKFGSETADQTTQSPDLPLMNHQQSNEEHVNNFNHQQNYQQPIYIPAPSFIKLGVDEPAFPYKENLVPLKAGGQTSSSAVSRSGSKGSLKPTSKTNFSGLLDNKRTSNSNDSQRKMRKKSSGVSISRKNSNGLDETLSVSNKDVEKDWRLGEVKSNPTGQLKPTMPMQRLIRGDLSLRKRNAGSFAGYRGSGNEKMSPRDTGMMMYLFRSYPVPVLLIISTSIQ